VAVVAIKITCIYCLYDPRDPQQIPMYVGKGLANRAQSHWKYFLHTGKTVNPLLYTWFEQLKLEGVEPHWKFLEKEVLMNRWQEAEKLWIGLSRVVNPKLCNVSSGGNAFHISHIRAVELGKKYGMLGGCRTHEHAVKMGQIGGNRSKELYPEMARQCGLNLNSLAALAKSRTPEHQKEASDKGGWALMHKNNPGKARELGLKYGHLSQESGRHTRWHVARHQFNPDCSLCQAKLNLKLDFFSAEEQQ